MAVLIFVLGLVFGSFYCVIATRIPRGEKALLSRSRCDHCKKELKWYNLIPVFSYVFQRGKCSSCGKRIDVLHLVVELACGVFFLLGYWMYGISYELFMYLIAISLMMIIFITDFIYMIILDSPLVVASVLIIVVRFIYNGFSDVLSALLAGLILFWIMFGVSKLGEYLFKREALGGGDIKFAFVMGLLLGAKLGVTALIFSTFLALPYSVAAMYLKNDSEVAFGPFLAGALVIILIYADKFLLFLEWFFQAF